MFTIVVMLLSYRYYVARVWQLGGSQLGTLLVVTVVFIIAQGVARRLPPTIFTRRTPSPLESQASPSAARAAYYVLLAGTFSTLITSVITTEAWFVPNLVLSLVLAAIIEHTTELFLLRRLRSLPRPDIN